MNEQKDPLGKNRQTFKWLLIAAAVLFICGLSSLFEPLCGVPLILVILFLLPVSTPQVKKLIKISIALFVSGAILSRVEISQEVNFALLFLPYVAAPLLAIIAIATQLRDKQSGSRAKYLFLIIFIIGFFLVNIRTYITWVTPYIYMPPVITNENFKVYTQCIEYVKNHEGLKGIVFYSNGVVSESMVPHDQNEFLSKQNDVVRISKEPQTAAIAGQLGQITCPIFERHDDVVIFFKIIDPKDIWQVWSNGHGVVYSLSGRDPNQSDDPILEKYKPFTKIYGNWYLSRGLLKKWDGRLGYSIPPISKTLIDRSLSLDNIDPNNLNGLIK